MRDVLNEHDGIYNDGGDQLLLEPVEISAEAITAAAEAAQARLEAAEVTPEPELSYDQDGYTATFTIGLDLS
jgi:hypothetical protein